MIDKQYSNAEVLRRFLEPVRKDSKQYIIASLIYTIWYVFTIMQTIAFSEMTTALTQHSLDYFWKILIVFVIANIIYQIITYSVRDISWMPCMYSTIRYLRHIYYTKFVQADNTQIEKIGTGRMISIIGNGIDTWKELIVHGNTKLVELFVQSVFVLYVVSKLGLIYTFGFIVLSIVIQVAVNIIAKYGNIRRQKRRDIQDDVSRQDVKILMSKFEVLMSNKISHEMSISDGLYDKAHIYDKKQNIYEHIGYNLPSVSFVIIKIVLFAAAAFSVYNSGDNNYGLIVLVIGAMTIIENAIRNMSDFQKSWIKSIQRVYKLWSTFDTIEPLQGLNDGPSFYYRQGDISLKNISFSYSEGKPVFEKFSLNIQGGKKTALVGLSGSGKTTLMKLISGYMRPDSGEILVDEQDLSEVSLQSYYAHIGYLTQEPSVFDGTIRENLMYGLLEDMENKEDRENRVNEAIRLAHCDFVYDLPHGLDTEIGEKGIRLSGGQRQRLAIAKIFLKNPQLIFLDEPTSALDSLSEKLISDAFHNLFQHRTVVIIAHRLQTVKESDEIIVLGGEEKGIKEQQEKENVEQTIYISTKVLERGTHKQLSKAGGVYQEMLELQSGFNF